MLANIFSTGNISFILVFLEGLLSFFSPCVIPLIPIYMSYLAGNTKQTLEDGTIRYERKKVFFHTIFFILGISSAFFLLGMSFTALGTFFKENQLLFTRIGGILILILGLVQIGFLDISFFQKERRINLSARELRMNPIAAFVLGFTFSFAWTPCVGPALSSVLIMASGSSSALVGNLLVIVYAAGFVIPFLILGLFTTHALNFLKKHKNLLKYTVKSGGVILILIGIMTFTGWMNSVSSYLNKLTPAKYQENTDNSYTFPTPDAATSGTVPTDVPSATPGASADNSDNNSSGSSDSKKKNPAFDFTLTDQYGNVHTLSDYKGKVVFLNFWATWCPPCKGEIPDIEALYNEYGKNEGDVIFLGVANPKSDEYPNNSDVSKEEVTKFLKDNNYTFPVVFDETGDVLSSYYISAFPTTFMIDKDGNIYGYAPGALTKEMMKNAIEETLASTEK
ncbi:MAG TPA: cytochrome c biogenesis protein CcdA [Mobilitalea sp.]|nr:cytochrome c biogenesis protein CcdA [Mobilitalea sp.]